jgi:soluble lytic murein transglycosylase-like protein
MSRHRGKGRTALRGMIAAAALMTAVPAAVPARADPVDPWRAIIAEASGRFGIPDAWIIRVMRIESGGNTMRGGRPIVSRAGAMGLMQLMPGTWESLRIALGLGPNPHDPHDNIIAGTAYLRMMYDRFGYPGLFGAYNAGPGRYGAYVAGRSRLPVETIAYLARATGGAAPAYVAPISMGMPVDVRHENTLFFAVRNAPNVVAVTQSTSASTGLFISLHTVSGTQ